MAFEIQLSPMFTGTCRLQPGGLSLLASWLWLHFQIEMRGCQHTCMHAYLIFNHRSKLLLLSLLFLCFFYLMEITLCSIIVFLSESYLSYVLFYSNFQHIYRHLQVTQVPRNAMCRNAINFEHSVFLDYNVWLYTFMK